MKCFAVLLPLAAAGQSAEPSPDYAEATGHVQAVDRYWHSYGAYNTFHFAPAWDGEHNAGSDVFYALNAHVQGSVPINRYCSKWGDSTFHPAPEWENEWNCGNDIFYAFTEQRPGTVAINRYWEDIHKRSTFHPVPSWGTEHEAGKDIFYAYAEAPQCNAHAACGASSGDCCPTAAGEWLECCGGAAGTPASTPWPTLKYDPKAAETFAALSQAAYCSAEEAKLKDWSCEACKRSGMEVVPGSVRIVHHAEVSEPDATFMYTARVKAWDGVPVDACIVAVRGSSNYANWVINFEAWPVSVPHDLCPGCQVEAGFWSVWADAQDQVKAALAEVGCVPASHDGSVAQGKTNKLWVTGHSLGGAVATAGIFSMQKLGYQVQQGFTFEAPRLGNKIFAAAFDGLFGSSVPLWRLTHANDPVPHVPMEDLGYWHVGVEVYYDAAGNHHICNGGGEDPACADHISWPLSLSHAGDHCGVPFVPSGNICKCPVEAEAVMVV